MSYRSCSISTPTRHPDSPHHILLNPNAIRCRDAVVRTFHHAWGGYKAFAWGEDELLPLSKKGTHRFGLGGMIADNLDVMHLMGLKEELKQVLWSPSSHTHPYIDTGIIQHVCNGVSG